jgi:broad specificity phosphatase PhoE
MLVLCRHGRTATNAAARIQGRVDTDLDDVGRAQAAAIAAAVGPVDRVLSSPLRRAVATAEAFGAPVDVDDRWIELDYGDWDERPLGSVAPAEWARWRSDLGWAPPGGESLLALGGRVRDACAELAVAAAEGTVVVVSHVSPIKAAAAWALGVDDGVAWRMHLAPGSISRVAVRGGTPVLFSFNEVAHLPSGAAGGAT